MAGLVYLNALQNPFIYDDFHTVVANTSILDLGNLRAVVYHDMTRPLVNVTYAIDQFLWRGQLIGFHLTNLILHVVNVALLYRLTWHLAGDRGTDAPQRRTEAAFAAAALFAVHPMLSESVGYISARAEVLCGTFFLAGMLSGRRWLRGSASGTKWSWGLTTVLLWIAASATKETGAMLPLVLVAYDVALLPREGRGDRVRWRHAPLLTIAFLFGTLRLLVLRSVEYPGQAGLHWSYTWLALDVIRRYTMLLIVPLGQTAFHAVGPIASPLNLRVAIALALLAGMLAAAWRSQPQRWLGSLGVPWYVLLLIPGLVLTLFDQGEPMAEHRVYLASCGFFIAAGDAAARLAVWLEGVGHMRRLATAAFAVVLLAAGALTITRNRVWSNPIVLWGEAVDKAPEHYRPRLLLGEALEDAGRRPEAIDEYRTAIALRPSVADGYLKLGQLLARTGQLDAAREQFRQAVRVDPGNRDVRQSMAVLDRMTSP